MDVINKMLFDNMDIKYKDFNGKLIPNIDKDKIIGVRRIYIIMIILKIF